MASLVGKPCLAYSPSCGSSFMLLALHQRECGFVPHAQESLQQWVVRTRLASNPACCSELALQTPDSGHVRPRQGTEICSFGALSPLDFFEFSPVDFLPFSSGFLCHLVRKSPQMCRKERCVESCHVSGCHGFFGLDRPLNAVPSRGRC